MGAAAMNDLPPGFVIDNQASAATPPVVPSPASAAPPEQAYSGLPPGFVIDSNQASPDSGSTLGGIAKSFGAGAVQGVAGLAGLPFDLAHLAAPAGTPNQFGSAALQKLAEGYTGPLHQPQGAIEETAAKIGQFLPAIIGGPEGLATRALTRVVAPAVGSEVAGKATQGTALQPYAEVAGALAGGAGATAAARQFQNFAAARSAAGSVIPTGEQLVKTGGNQFQQARDMNVVVKPDFATGTAADMRTALKDYDPEDAGVKDVFRKIDRLDNLAMSVPGLPPTAVAMNDIENVRKQLSKLRMSSDATTRSAAKTALDTLTNNQLALTPADVVSGDGAGYVQTMRNAVGNYGAGKRSLIVQGKQDLAELNSNTAGSGANVDNATRQAIKQLARPINNTNVPVAKRLGFNDAEVEAIKNAATGTVAGNTARYLGKAAPTGAVSFATGVMGGHALGGPIGAAVVPSVGYLAKKIGDLSTKRAVAALDSLVRSRSPLAAQVAAQLPTRIVQRISPQSRLLLTSAIAAGGAIPQINQPPAGPVGQPPRY